MSQFNYPRINFSGKCIMDPSTANNSWYLPLIIFDPITIEPFLPPRIYLQDQYLRKGVTQDTVKYLLPEGCEIKEDQTTMMRGTNYFEILPVNTEFLFKEWARIPLGESDLDKEYWELYHLFWVPTNRTSLDGCVPGYWNYYGSMGYAFKDVEVTSIATGITNQAEKLFSPSDEIVPKEVKAFLGATLTMNTDPIDDSTNACVMVDHLPTMAMHTQLFTEKLSLYKRGKFLMSGCPDKGALRKINAFRVVNENMPFAGSGVFYSVIRLDQLESESSEAIFKLIKKFGDKKRTLKGVFVRQVLSEIEEFRNVDYRITGNIPNPAYGHLSGSISPWYEGEMMTWPGGRQLVGDAPYIVGKSEAYDAPVSLMTPCSFNIDKSNKVVQIDFLNNFPLINKATSDKPLEPNPNDENEYETYDLGVLDFILESPHEDDLVTGIHIGSIHISEKVTPRAQLYESGAFFVLPLHLPKEFTNKPDAWNLNIYGHNNKGGRVRLYKESPIVIMTDQVGLYCSEGDDPVQGFISFTGHKESCYLRIFERGKPLKKLIDISIIEIKMNISGSQKTEKLYRNAQYKDGDMITFDTYEPLNAIYLFMPYYTTVVPPRCYPSEVVRTGFFINLKVLPRHDYGRYLDPTHPDYPTEVTFKVLHEHIFLTFSLLSPTMVFHEERFENAFMAHELLKRTSLENWERSWYMPVTRDLSSDQRALIEKWAQKYSKEAAPLELAEQDSSHQHYHTHLKDTDFFAR